MKSEEPLPYLCPLNYPKTSMKVFKFGGTSVNSVERIKNTGHILKLWEGEKIMVIVSAMGKTTNALEKVVDAFFEGRKDDALNLFEQVTGAVEQYVKDVKTNSFPSDSESY